MNRIDKTKLHNIMMKHCTSYKEALKMIFTHKVLYVTLQNGTCSNDDLKYICNLFNIQASEILK